jgi:hypothetical protein
MENNGKDKIIISLLIFLLVLLSVLYLLLKTQFFELCKKCCNMLGYEEIDTGKFGMECKCISNRFYLNFPLNLSTLLGA